MLVRPLLVLGLFLATACGGGNAGAAPGTPAPVLGLGKPLALLIYLSAAPGRSASRSR